MKTNNIENQTKTDPSDPVEEITSIPRSVVAMAKDFPNGHLIPFHQHARSQLLYASSGVMTAQQMVYGLSLPFAPSGYRPSWNIR